MLSQQDKAICSSVLKNLKGERYKDWNYLFLTPFDLSQVPGYLDVVENPMDLQTVSQNLEMGEYQSVPEVWADIKTTFENAIKYHSERETKWIAKMAKDMIKFFNKERKSAEKRKESAAAAAAAAGGAPATATAAASAAPQPPKLKLKMGKQLPLVASKTPNPAAGPPPVKSQAKSPSAAAIVPVAAPAASETVTSAPSAVSSSATEPTPPPKKKKAKINLKLPTTKKSKGESSSDVAVASSSASAPPAPSPANVPSATTTTGDNNNAPKPKIRFKFKTSSASSAGAATSAGPPSSSSTTIAPSPAKSSSSKSAGTPTPPATVSTPVPPAPPASAPSSTKSASSSTKPSKPSNSSNNNNSTTTKISVKLGNSRGKELPKGVAQSKSSAASAPSSSSAAPPQNETKPPPPPPTAPAASSTSTPSTPAAKAGQKRKRVKGTTKSKESTGGVGGTSGGGASGGGGGGGVGSSSSGTLQPGQLQACAKVLLALKRRKQKSCSWFLSPVTDKTIIQDYRAKIKHPMDIGKISTKVDSKSYKSLADFCLDLRRIFSNCLCFNTSTKEALRPVALDLIDTSEELVNFFFAEAGVTDYPRLLYCWKLCMEILGTLYNIVNPDDGQPTVLYFLFPVKLYCGGQFPSDYLEKVKKPMDFQTITSNLLEGRYQAVDEFSNDCKLIVSNCIAYYSGRDDGKLYIDQANRLADVMTQQLDQLARYDKTPKAAADRQKANTLSLSIIRPSAAVLLSILTDLRAIKYTDKATKIVEAAMGPFEKPVSLAIFPDYLQHVSEQMDLQTVERKTNSGTYTSPEHFEYDMALIFRNCEKYHSQRNGEHLVSMAKFGAKNFRRIFCAKMKALEDPTSATPSKPEPVAQSPVEPASSASPVAQPPTKKQKTETGSVAKVKTATAPRVSIAANTTATSALSVTAAAAAARAKSPKLPVPTSNQKKNNTPPKPVNSNQPVPLHIAIAKVKEEFPLRRAVKSLVSWEADCARYFKELLRHPWLSAARPKFIFHVPVTMLFPELREAYAAKIRKPMDLTTVECTLLAGGRYASCEDLIEDVALTFSNAIRFNKDGRDIGDPLSCAYYDASVHLLRYARWLSLELLSAYVEDVDHVDDVGPDGIPPVSWKLTKKNRELAQKEQHEIVIKEPIEKSLEGDRFSWHEGECEKLLKALRHQSDLKYMTYFIRADYPPDYTAFISKPMDWEKVQKTLKKRHYDNFGQIIEDLRLIFKNALKYNARLKDRAETVSGQAYAAAEYMSAKLETAIRKLMLSVSDRIERERIDHANAEREIDAEQRAEEARIRAAWKKDPDGNDGNSSAPTIGARGSDGSGKLGGNSLGQKIRLVRRPLVRKEATDFEIPFFDDEDDAQHERSFVDLIKMQKSMFEKQRQEISRMRQIATTIGSSVYTRLLQKTLALKWAEQHIANQTPAALAPAPSNISGATGGKTAPENKGNAANDKKVIQPSCVLQEMEKADRGQIKISLAKPKTQRKPNKKRPLLFEDDETL